MRVLREGLSLYRKRCAFRYLGRLDPPVGASAGLAPRGGRRARERRAVAGPPFGPSGSPRSAGRQAASPAPLRAIARQKAASTPIGRITSERNPSRLSGGGRRARRCALPRNSNTRGHREQDAGRRCEPDAPASGEGRAIVRLKEVGPTRSSCRRTWAKRLKSRSSHSPPSRATWLASALGVRERGSSTESKTALSGSVRSRQHGGLVVYTVLPPRTSTTGEGEGA